MNDYEGIKTKAESLYQSNVTDQYTRLKLLKYAPVIIGLSNTLQGKYEMFGWFRQIRHGKGEKVLKRILYYEFIAVIESYRIKIIVRKLEDGALHFWSIIPFWKKQTSITESLER